MITLELTSTKVFEACDYMGIIKAMVTVSLKELRNDDFLYQNISPNAQNVSLFFLVYMISQSN